jgi:hypothetical protein
MPVVRIPLDAVAMASRITFGIRFTVPGDPALDGTRFKRWYGGGRRLEELVGLLQARGITVQTMPRPERVKGFLRDFAIAQRPGWIWRDRGWLGFVESAVALAMVVGALLALGFFSDLPTLMLVWFTFIMFVIVWGWFVGYRHRKKMLRQRRGRQL